MKYSILWTLVLVAFSMPSAASVSYAQDAKTFVSLILPKASAERWGKQVIFRCEAILDNATGKDLVVRSHFFSEFDGLQLVVTSEEGKTLAQQRYTFHQSPFVPNGREFTLKQNETKRELSFPIDLPEGVLAVKVRLVGTLPNCDYQDILSSETIGVAIKKAEGNQK